MSEKNRSLASYFDYPGDASLNWHDQTEPVGQVAPVQTSAREGLGKWAYSAGNPNLLWVPHDKTPDDANVAKVQGHTIHYKSDKTWKPTDWGYEEYMHRQAMAHQEPDPNKAPKPKMSPEEHAVWKSDMATARQELKKVRSKQLKTLHDQAYDIVTRTSALGEVNQVMGPIIESVHGSLELAKTQSKNSIASLKASGIKGKAKMTSLHAETSSYIDDSAVQEMLNTIDGFCRHHGLFNTVGTDLPPKNRDGTRYLSVEIMFLGKMKQVIMSGLLHVMAKQAKSGTADKNQCDFVNTSYEANNILAKMHKRERYLHRYNDKLADSAALEQCRRMILNLEIKRFKGISKKKTLPKYLKFAPPGNGGQQGKKKGAGHSNEAEAKEVKLILDIIHQRKSGESHHHGRGHHGKGHHGKGRDGDDPRMKQTGGYLRGYQF